MRYLRMLSNSLAAASIATAYMLILVLDLNPAFTLSPSRLRPLVFSVGAFYLLHLTAIAYVLLVIRQLFARELFSPAWISVGVLMLLVTITAAAAAIVMWLNVMLFSVVLDARALLAIEQAIVVLAGTIVVCAAIGLLRHRWPHSRIWLGLMTTVALAGSIAAPLALRGRGTLPVLDARPIDAPLAPPLRERAARVAVIALDAASLDFVTGAAAEGRLPNFGRLLDAGAVRHLATIHPTSPETVWAAAATGKLPQKNGVRSAGTYAIAHSDESIQLLPQFCFANRLLRFGLLIEEPLSSTTLRARTLWSILSVQGASVGVVGWPLTQPAPNVNGYLVSDAFPRASTMPSGIEDPTIVYPPELEAAAIAAMESVTSDGAAVNLTSVAEHGERRHDTPARVDAAYDKITQSFATTRPVQVTLTRFQSLDPIGHYFLRYAMATEFGDVTDEERRRFGGVLERHYAMIDQAIGGAIRRLGPDDLLLVVSGYGMEPLGVWRRLMERAIGDPDISGSHDDAPDGFLIAYGTAVSRGRLASRPSIVDVTPTILYFLGLPVARDMDGYVRTDLFQRAFTDERPITFIPTYEK